MRSTLVAALLGTALACSILVSPAAAAWPHDASNLAIANSGFNYENPEVVSDGSGGAIITWQQNGAPTFKDVFAQHVLASGILDPAWPAPGRSICSATDQQQDPKLVADGAGGAIIVWEDLRSGTSFDLYAQHVLASGVVDPAWPLDGRAIAVAAGDQFSPVITTDGAGGAIIAWRDHRNGLDDDVFVQRINAGGNVVYPVNGTDLTAGQPNNQNGPAICPDGAGGAVVTWTDGRALGTNLDDIYAQRVSAFGGIYWGAGGKAICTNTQEQQSPVVIRDQADGFILAWADRRPGITFDIYAMRIGLAGDLQWPANGVAVCSAASDQSSPLAVADGAGGANIVWLDNRNGASDVYAQHVLFSGIADPVAPVDGRAVCAAASAQVNLRIIGDGGGGAIAAWTDYRNGAADVYAGHVQPAGTIDPVWPVNGRALATAPNYQWLPTLCSDAAGGAIVTWEDSRNGSISGSNGYDIYAQRVERFGYLGTPGASIAGVRDVPSDQGGRIKLSWDASYLDTGNDPNLSLYDVYRSVPPLTAVQRIAAGASLRHAPGDSAEKTRRSLLTTGTNASTYYWEYLASINAQHFLPGYSYLAATAGDSTGATNPRTSFMVVARNVSGSFYWLSAPDSGYSVDNLPPYTPAPLTGVYAAGATHLHWNRNTDADLADYRVYRGTTAAFVPGPANLIASPPDTGFADPGAAGGFYKLSAVDVHGNESGYAALAPGGTLDAGSDERLSFALIGPRPNPAHGNRMSVEFVLALPQPARLELLDVSGRLVATRNVGSLGAGRHIVDLAGGRRLAPGFYLLRLTQGTSVRSLRAIVLE